MPRFPHSNYWIQANNTARPYTPPICHREYGDILARPVASGFSAMFSVSLFNRNTTARATCDAVSIIVENHNAPATLASTSYTPADADGPIVREICALPLTENDDGTIAQAIWIANTRIVFSVSGLTGLHWARLELVQRGGATVTILDEMPANVITHRLLDGTDAMAQEDRAGKPHIVVPLSYARLINLDQLTPANSPCKLRLRVRDQERAETEAWTYVHVPHAKDVAKLQEFADQKIILLRDRMQGVAHVAGCTLEQDADTSAMYLTEAETSAFTTRSINARKTKDQQRLPGERAELTQMQRRLEELRVRQASTSSSSEEGRHLADDIDRTERQIKGKESLIARLEGEAPDHVPPLGLDPSALAYSKHETNLFVPRDGGKFFFALSWAIILVARRGPHGWYAHRLYAPTKYKLMRAHDAHWNVEVASDRTFAANKWRGGGQDTWHQYNFAADAYPLERAVTFGVSACSASVIFPDTAAPDFVILSHINNDQSFPMPTIIGDLVADGVVPAASHLRGLITVFPQYLEIDKYLATRMFPPAMQANARVIAMPRSRHLYGVEDVSNYGHESFGLEFSGADVHFVGEYGLMQWSNAMAMLWSPLLAHQDAACGCRRDAHRDAKIKSDFDLDNFGPNERLKETKNTLGAFQTFMTGVRAGGKGIEEELNDSLARARRKFKFAQLGSALFGAVDGAATELRNTELNLLYGKVMDTLGGRDADPG